MKRHNNGLVAAFISVHVCHDVYIFASDGTALITAGLSDHDGVNIVWGTAKKKPADHHIH